MDIIRFKSCDRCGEGDTIEDRYGIRCVQCGWAGPTDDNPPPVLPEGEVGLVSYYASIRLEEQMRERNKIQYERYKAKKAAGL